MPIINVDMWEGFSAEKKQEFMEELTKTAMNVLSMPPDKVLVVLRDTPLTNWSQGATPATDQDFLVKSRRTEL